jgi:hypothetical protein
MGIQLILRIRELQAPKTTLAATLAPPAAPRPRVLPGCGRCCDRGGDRQGQTRSRHRSSASRAKRNQGLANRSRYWVCAGEPNFYIDRRHGCHFVLDTLASLQRASSMPWRARSVTGDRLCCLLVGNAMTDRAGSYTGYKIFNRHEEHGFDSLTDQSRPLCYPLWGHFESLRAQDGSLICRSLVLTYLVKVTLCPRFLFHRRFVIFGKENKGTNDVNAHA